MGCDGAAALTGRRNQRAPLSNQCAAEWVQPARHSAELRRSVRKKPHSKPSPVTGRRGWPAFEAQVLFLMLDSEDPPERMYLLAGRQ